MTICIMVVLQQRPEAQLHRDDAQPFAPADVLRPAQPAEPQTLAFTEGLSMLHPNQFHVNEAWITFKLSDAPIRTDRDGDFNLIALMDASSCLILGSATIPASAPQPSKMEAKRLLKQGQARMQMPKTLFIPSDQPADFLTVEAERQGITVVRVPEDQLLRFIGEAKMSFRERFGGGGTQ
jgi:hypothetical protein